MRNHSGRHFLEESNVAQDAAIRLRQARRFSGHPKNRPMRRFRQASFSNLSNGRTRGVMCQHLDTPVEHSVALLDGGLSDSPAGFRIVASELGLSYNPELLLCFLVVLKTLWMPSLKNKELAVAGVYCESCFRLIYVSAYENHRNLRNPQKSSEVSRYLTIPRTSGILELEAVRWKSLSCFHREAAIMVPRVTGTVRKKKEEVHRQHPQVGRLPTCSAD
jgi:hypothetical protein